MSSGKKKPDGRSYTAEEIETAKFLLDAFCKMRDEAWAHDPALKAYHMKGQEKSSD